MTIAKIDTPAPWQTHPPMIAEVRWWNHKSAKSIFPDAIKPPVIHKSFERALASAIEHKGCVVVWASRLSQEKIAACENHNVPVVRLEDGFIRSVGLGAGLVGASSLVLDTRGIYYNGSQPSDLEWLLENVDLNKQQIVRATNLRNLIIEKKLTKYNLAPSSPLTDHPEHIYKVLVPGQVSNDASINTATSNSIDLKQAANINLALLQEARRNNPNAYIIFKPHPDVSNGLRQGHIPREQALQYADTICEQDNILSVIDTCDKVETISSLSGFEALLRHKDVTVHGTPFYAGWGLTQDTTPIPRRSRRRTLDEMVYISLILYPRYISQVDFKPCEPEQLIAELHSRGRDKLTQLLNSIKKQIVRLTPW